MGNHCCVNSAKYNSVPLPTAKPLLSDTITLQTWYKPSSLGTNFFDFSQLAFYPTHSIGLNKQSKSVKYNAQYGFSKCEQQTVNPGELSFHISDHEHGGRVQLTQHTEWRCIVWRELTQKGEEIRVGDQIRVGRIKMELLHLLAYDEISAMKREIKEEVKKISNGYVSQECRVCFEGEESEENPLISPCQCQGSVSRIHRKCLSKWIFNGKIYDHLNVFKLGVKRLECQLCKSSLKPYIWRRFMSLIDIYNGTYAIFQANCMVENKQNMQQIQYIVFRFDCIHDCLTIGRSSLCDHQVEDRLVSKINSSIEFRAHKLWVKDMKSRFGTAIDNRAEHLEIGNKYLIGNVLVNVGL